MMKMTTQEFKAFEKAMHDLIDGVNEKFGTKQKETLEKVKEMLNEKDNQSAATSDEWHEFNKVERYLDSLIRVSSIGGHKVHDEINDAVKKLKEMAYQG
jgi:uncharacterized membrane protein YheB (UPF0754 family)